VGPNRPSYKTAQRGTVTPWAIKRSQLIFVCNFIKNQQILMQFRNERYMWQYEFYSTRLISVATLPCESQNTENVTLQPDVTKENYIRCVIGSSKWTRVIMCLTFTYMGVIQQNVHETKIHDIDNLHNAWCKLLLYLTGTSSMLAWPFEIMCACWWWTL